jgi:Alg9-like mannosyltransferase family.
VSDRLFYGFWTFPPLRFLYFNIAQSLAVFYGRNRLDYYVTEGYPLLLTTALPFALVGLYRTLKIRAYTPADQVQTTIRVQLATVCLVMPFVLSLIAHKEVRFIYPLLPSLHILAAPPLVQYFYPALYSRSSRYTPQRLTLLFLVLANVVIALYTTIFHASGPLNVFTYLRNQHDRHAAEGQDTPYSHLVGIIPEPGITAGFLMPCHSTPWRSHLVYPSIHAWALSCEPPVDFSEEEKAVYRDEADQFYDDPSQFLRGHMVGGLHRIPRRPSYGSGSMTLSTPSNPTQHQWPDYLVFFAQLEPTLRGLLRTSPYGECWRTHNTHWHDDWRRRGDIIVWCLDASEQNAWRSETSRREKEVETTDSTESSKQSRKKLSANKSAPGNPSSHSYPNPRHLQPGQTGNAPRRPSSPLDLQGHGPGPPIPGWTPSYPDSAKQVPRPGPGSLLSLPGLLYLYLHGLLGLHFWEVSQKPSGPQLATYGHDLGTR